jgi:hypothetical protein
LIAGIYVIELLWFSFGEYIVWFGNACLLGIGCVLSGVFPLNVDSESYQRKA